MGDEGRERQIKGTRDNGERITGEKRQETERERERKNKKRDLSGVSDSSDGSGPSSAAAHSPFPSSVLNQPPTLPPPSFPFRLLGVRSRDVYDADAKQEKSSSTLGTWRGPKSSVGCLGVWFASSPLRSCAGARRPLPKVPSNKTKMKK